MTAKEILQLVNSKLSHQREAVFIPSVKGPAETGLDAFTVETTLFSDGRNYTGTTLTITGDADAVNLEEEALGHLLSDMVARYLR